MLVWIMFFKFKYEPLYLLKSISMNEVNESNCDNTVKYDPFFHYLVFSTHFELFKVKLDVKKTWLLTLECVLSPLKWLRVPCPWQLIKSEIDLSLQRVKMSVPFYSFHFREGTVFLAFKFILSIYEWLMLSKTK